ncbi:major centromere autoantigen B-like isoform X2 [Nerophis ophidion]|uniref:major centromere autoantigen B-like isoform X2 n=1 Tax=Nerophis ophidion TaxID=159077 RepID=UPI002AE06A07|nr:major centromere autoantigen B-like isoform X2 [Nerophis ophidion]XP_061742740.1 major centromere autoantigen B-like isoform X2 [Nerophis ophidion]
MEQEQARRVKEEEEEPQSPRVKEEEEEHSISQEEFDRPEGDHVIRVIVKSEDGEVKGESEERKEAEPPSSSSTEADEDHCGGSQADKLLAPLSDSEDTTSHSPDTDDEDSKDDKTRHADNTHFTCSLCDKNFNQHYNLKVKLSYGSECSEANMNPYQMSTSRFRCHRLP